MAIKFLQQQSVLITIQSLPVLRIVMNFSQRLTTICYPLLKTSYSVLVNFFNCFFLDAAIRWVNESCYTTLIQLVIINC